MSTKQMRYYYRNKETLNNQTCVRKIMENYNFSESDAKRLNAINKKLKDPDISEKKEYRLRKEKKRLTKDHRKKRDYEKYMKTYRISYSDAVSLRKNKKILARTEKGTNKYEQAKKIVDKLTK